MAACAKVLLLVVAHAGHCIEKFLSIHPLALLVLLNGPGTLCPTLELSPRVCTWCCSRSPLSSYLLLALCFCLEII
jgi:hypothetical protein